MKKLDKYLLKSFIGPLVLTFFISMFILIMQFLWKWIDDFVGKGIEWHVFAELLFYTSITLAPMAIMLAVLLSSIMTFGNLGENYELTAMKASGLPLTRIMRPLTILIVIISISAFVFSNEVIPNATMKYYKLLSEIVRKSPEIEIKEGVFYHGIKDYSIRIGSKNKKTSTLYDLMIYDHTNGKVNSSVTLADSGYMKFSENKDYLILQLFSGASHSSNVDHGTRKKNESSYPYQRDRFEEKTLLIDISGIAFKRSKRNIWSKHYKALKIGQLKYAIDSLDDQISNTFQKDATLLKTRYYFKREDKTNFIDLPDSIRFKEYPAYLNMDSIRKNMSLTEQKMLMETVHTKASATKNKITQSVNTKNYHIKFVRNHQVAWHQKFILSVACLVFFFIGVPLGAIIRKGGLGMPVVVSVLLFIAYYIISFILEKNVKANTLPPAIGMWLPTFIFLPFGLLLTIKASKDSPILNTDSYVRLYRKIFHKKGKDVGNP